MDRESRGKPALKSRTGLNGRSPARRPAKNSGAGRKPRPQEFAHPLFAQKPPRQKRAESLGDFAYRVLRHAVRAGQFKPREHLREAEVAAWLGISRTPVREAFHRIVSEGLLVSGPWNGVMLAELAGEQVKQLYTVREALEGIAAGLAAEHATKEEVDLLFEIAAREARESKDPDRLAVINTELHQVLYRAAHNPYLLQALSAIVDALGPVRHSTAAVPDSIESAHRDHLRIIEAIRDGKRREAEISARAHVRNSLSLRLKLIRSCI